MSLLADFKKFLLRGNVVDLAVAVVVGSAIVNQIAEQGRSPDLVKNVGAFVKSLAEAVKTI